MPQSKSSPTSPAWVRPALIALAIALAGSVAYIVGLRGRIAELEQQLAAGRAASAQAAPALAAAKPAPTAAIVPAELFAANKRDAMIAALKTEADPNRKAWFHVQQNQAESAAVLATLQQVFADAGWPVEVVRTPYPVKSGVFLLAGDTEPAAFVNTANDAFAAGGLDVQYLTGYREFAAERKKANAAWVGPELKADQAFTIVIGGKPAPKSN